jgi:signal transduction histidine kinase
MTVIRLSLSRRIALGYLLTTAIVLAVQGLVFIWLVERGSEPPDPDLTQRLAVELSQSLEANPRLNLDERVSRLDPGEAVFAILNDGRVSSPRKPVPAGVVQSVLDAFDRPITDNVVRGWARSQYLGAPITDHGTVIGALGIIPLTTVERFGGQVAAIGLGLLLLGTLISSVLIIGPVRSRIQDLRRAASRLGAGDFAVRAREEGKDEVSELARAFNAMADELERRAVALQSSDRARRQLVADVSHELMTPLTAILGHLETLTMAEVRLDDERRLRHVAITTREAKRLERLIGDLLDMARLEAGGGDLEIQRVGTRDLFEQVVAHHEHDCRARNICIVSSVQDGAETFDADPFRLEQALENVTANAIRYTPDGGTITLKAERTGGSVALTVTDEGEGIAAEHLPHIFDRFYKTASAKGIASRGSGLGLSIVKAVVARHGGRVSAESAVGRGTTIRLELPAADAPPSHAGPTLRSGAAPELKLGPTPAR